MILTEPSPATLHIKKWSLVAGRFKPARGTLTPPTLYVPHAFQRVTLTETRTATRLSKVGVDHLTPGVLAPFTNNIHHAVQRVVLAKTFVPRGPWVAKNRTQDVTPLREKWLVTDNIQLEGPPVPYLPRTHIGDV